MDFSAILYIKNARIGVGKRHLESIASFVATLLKENAWLQLLKLSLEVKEAKILGHVVTGKSVGFSTDYINCFQKLLRYVIGNKPKKI